jgi:hypothetical protein
VRPVHRPPSRLTEMFVEELVREAGRIQSKLAVG